MLIKRSKVVGNRFRKYTRVDMKYKSALPPCSKCSESIVIGTGTLVGVYICNGKYKKECLKKANIRKSKYKYVNKEKETWI